MLPRGIRGSTCTCKCSLVQQQTGRGVTVWAVVQVDQGAVEYQINLQFLAAWQTHKVLVLCNAGTQRRKGIRHKLLSQSRGSSKMHYPAEAH